MKMASQVKEILDLIQDQNAKFVDLRFTDTHGKEQHVSLPVSAVDEDFFKHGKPFDGSSVEGWKDINESDMLLMPDLSTAVMDPFFEQSTLNLRCDVLDPKNMEGYERDPRSIAKKAVEYLQSTGIADQAYFGPEPEFFVFDGVEYGQRMEECFYRVQSEEGAWSSEESYEGGNMGHRPSVKGGYFPVPPVDSSQDLRSEMCAYMEQMGLHIEAHHHEVATGNQNEIATRFNTLVKKADELQIYKYVVHNVAHLNGKSATFMPKPLVGDNGSGMHVHQSLSKDGHNIFAGDLYGGLSQEALYYIGGIIKHAKALNAFANASTNSYKRLVPGFEAPVLLAYSARNRSASIRIPHVASEKARRIEVRFPDPTANPYLAFSAMMLAGLDGIKNKIDPGEAIDRDLYALSKEELKDIPHVAVTLNGALKALDEDRAFLTDTGVFCDDVINAYIDLKREHVEQLRMSTHPLEFQLYYSV